MLGEAYAFGVVWSFAMKALSVLVLRYKQPGGPRMESTAEFSRPRGRDSARAGDRGRCGGGGVAGKSAALLRVTRVTRWFAWASNPRTILPEAS